MANRVPNAQLKLVRIGSLTQTTVFDGSGSYDPEGHLDRWLLDFGDGQFIGGDGVPGPYLEHQYSSADTYDAVLNVWDKSHREGQDEVTVTIEAAPPNVVLKITSVSPASGSTDGGTIVQIEGDGFQFDTQVQFGNLTAQTLSVAPDGRSLTCSTPAMEAAMKVDLTVINSDGQKAVLQQAYDYISAPIVQSVAPSSGPAAGGTQVTIAGTGFLPGVQVTFGAKPAQVLSVSADGKSIVCITPAQ